MKKPLSAKVFKGIFHLIYTMGLMNGRKLKKARKRFRDNRLPDKKKRLGISLKFDPLGRAAQAKGIVTKKISLDEAPENIVGLQTDLSNCKISYVAD